MKGMENDAYNSRMCRCRRTGGKRCKKNNELMNQNENDLKEVKTMLTIVNCVLAAACLVRAITRD